MQTNNYLTKPRNKKFFFYLMLAKQKGKMTTSKEQENIRPKRRLQRVTDNNTQTDERRLSHLSKNPMKKKNEKESYCCDQT
jgi:hypothetical protein